MTFRRMFFIIFSFLFIQTPKAFSGEIDHFSRQGDKHFDATPAVNRIINEYLDILATKTQTCDRETIINNARFLMDTNFPAIKNELARVFKLEFDQANKVVAEAVNSGLAESDPVKHKQRLLALEAISRTQNFKSDSYQGFSGPRYDACCSYVMEVGGVEMGIDKVDHFLSAGFFLFQESEPKTELPKANAEYYWPHEVVKKAGGEAAALKYNTFSENSSWGLAGTGVKSYGDLAANYQGYLFYKELVDGPNPYLKCENSRWKKTRNFQIQDYADESWDESINCSSYFSEKGRDRVLKNIEKAKKIQCPRSPEICKRLKEKHKDKAQNFLHPLCLDPLSKHTQVETLIEDRAEVLRYINMSDILKGAGGAK
jgi:hypothetical protein